MALCIMAESDDIECGIQHFNHGILTWLCDDYCHLLSNAEVQNVITGKLCLHAKVYYYTFMRAIYFSVHEWPSTDFTTDFTIRPIKHGLLCEVIFVLTMLIQNAGRIMQYF